MRYTHWQVITGAPCSGKTAVIRELENRGFRVVHEVARSFIEAQLKEGKSLTAVKADRLAFERHILQKLFGWKDLVGSVDEFRKRKKECK